MLVIHPSFWSNLKFPRRHPMKMLREYLPLRSMYS